MTDSNQHLTVDDLAGFRDGALPAEDVLRVGRHLAECRACAGAAHRAQPTTVVAEGLRHAIDDDETVPRIALRWRWIAAGAAASAVVAVSLLVFRQPVRTPPGVPIVRPVRPPVSRAIDYGRPGWNALVAQALANGDVPASVDLNALRPQGERVRGTAGAPEGLAPAGVVVESARPRFRWTPVPNAASYVVIVERGDRQIVRSHELHGTEWTPPLDLERDVTLRWQVQVTKKDGSMEEMPSPPSPPALIRVLGAAGAAELEEARRRIPMDSLLVGTLEARAGLLDDARRDLTAASAAHPNDAAIARLRDTIAHRR